MFKASKHKGRGRAVIFSAVTVAAFASVLAIEPGSARAWSASGGASSAPSGSPSGQPSSSSAQQSPGGNSPGQSTAGGTTSGSLPIESTILAYQSLQASARAIANAVGPNFATAAPPAAQVVIATPNDATAILQLRIVLGQAHVLLNRVQTLGHMLQHLSCMPVPRTPAPSPKPTATPPGAKPPPQPFFNNVNLSGVSALFSTPADITAMVTTAASLSAVQENLATASGNLGDVSLINFLAGDLAGKYPRSTLVVFVPSVFPPNLSGTQIGPDLHGTYIYDTINQIEWARQNVQTEWKRVTANPKCANDKYISQAAALVNAANAAVDAFENALFGTAWSTPSNAVAQAPAPAPAPKKGKKPGASAQTAAATPAPAAPAPSTPSPILGQLLFADLLLKQVGGDLDQLYLLSVHALESGGSQLTKQQMFLGTRQFYSGGAVATFSLYRNDGSLVCSGVTYGYRGFIQADDMTRAAGYLSDSPPVPRTNNHVPDLAPINPNAAPICQGL